MRISFRNDGTEGEGRIETKEEGSKERNPTPICVISASVKMKGFPVLVWTRRVGRELTS